MPAFHIAEDPLELWTARWTFASTEHLHLYQENKEIGTKKRHFESDIIFHNESKKSEFTEE